MLLLLYKTEKKNPAEAGFLVSVCPMKSRLGGNVSCLETLGSFFYLKGDRLTFNKCLEAIAGDCVEMYEYILTTVRRGNKTKTFGVVKPLYCTCSHITLYL
jgi:hypothetical protein